MKINSLDECAPSPEVPQLNALPLLEVDPWPEPVDGKMLFDELVQHLNRFVVLPKWAAEALALWIVHTYAFQLRDVSTYIGIESPEPRCGKTTLLTVLNALAYRAIASANISPPAFFRVIEDLCPTLLIDEADTFLHRNDQLHGILNSGYKRDTAFVLRVGPAAPGPDGEEDSENLASSGVVSRFSSWCPKAISQIGRLHPTLADRCIIIRMQRKTRLEECDRLRNLDVSTLKSQCARFVQDHRQQIAAALPDLPTRLSDRAADIWEPLFVLADLAGPEWSDLARQAAVGLATAAEDSNPIATLLLDIYVLFTLTKTERMFSRDIIYGLNKSTGRPWAETLKGKSLNELWLSHKLRPYGIRPKTIWIEDDHAKGYLREDFLPVCQRYISRADLDALCDRSASSSGPAGNGQTETGRSAPRPESSSSRLA